MDLQNKALVVEDEAAISNLLKIHLTGLGFEVDTCAEAESAFLKIQGTQFQLCLIDWMLPGTQGIDFLKKVRKQNQNIKMMMVTAKADPESVVEGLESGADDYLVKPFDARVLVARVRNLMQRKSISSNPVSVEDEMTIDGMTIHFTKYDIHYKNEQIHLTPSEFKLLAALFRAQGKVLTRDQLIDQIQGEDVSVTGRTIDTHVFALRKKLKDWADHIETIRGVGYRILISKENASEP